MAVQINKDKPREKFTSDRKLWLNADKTKVLEDGDPNAAYLLVGEGCQLEPEEAEKYGLTSKAAPAAKEAEEGEAEPSEGEQLKGSLPDDFPGVKALREAGYTSFGKLRKVKDLTEIPGIGKPTAVKIEEALNASNEETES